MRIVKLPNDQNAEFPDSMSNDQIESVLQNHFQQNSQQTTQPDNRNFIQKSGDFVDKYINKPVENYLNPAIKDASLGYAQGLANIPYGAANLASWAANKLPGVNIHAPESIHANFAPHDTAANIGNIASFFGPGILNSLGKIPGISHSIDAAMSIPRIAQAIKVSSNILQKSPLGTDVAKNALKGGVYNPTDPGTGILMGGAGPVVSKALNISNPIANAFARTAAGGLAGAGVGAVTGVGSGKGAEYGAALGLSGPKILNRLGIGGVKPGLDVLDHLNPHLLADSIDSAKRLNVNLSPGEISGDPFVTSLEAKYRRTGEAASEFNQIKANEVQKQNSAIDNLKSQISPGNGDDAQAIRDAANEHLSELKQLRAQAAGPYYKAAEKDRVAPELLTKLEKSDPNISNAIDSVLNNPMYQKEGELLNEPRNSLKVLDYAKRNLDSDIESNEGTIASPGDRNAVRVLTASKNNLLDNLDNFSPNYKKARAIFSDMTPLISSSEQSQLGRLSELKDNQLKNASKMIFDPSQTNLRVLSSIKSAIMRRNPDAWDGIVRNEIDRLTKQGTINGSNFFKKVLDNDNQFNQLSLALDHNPKAQQTLHDMKRIWGNLINKDKPNSAAAKTVIGVDQARQLFSYLDELSNSKRNVAAIKYLHSDEWQKDLSNIENIKDRQEKGSALASLLGKAVTASGIERQQG